MLKMNWKANSFYRFDYNTIINLENWHICKIIWNKEKLILLMNWKLSLRRRSDICLHVWISSPVIGGFSRSYCLPVICLDPFILGNSTYASTNLVRYLSRKCQFCLDQKYQKMSGKDLKIVWKISLKKRIISGSIHFLWGGQTAFIWWTGSFK